MHLLQHELPLLHTGNSTTQAFGWPPSRYCHLITVFAFAVTIDVELDRGCGDHAGQAGSKAMEEASPALETLNGAQDLLVRCRGREEDETLQGKDVSRAQAAEERGGGRIVAGSSKR